MPILRDLPVISQWGDFANKRRTDCGAACVAMLLEYFGKRGHLTVDQLALETTLATSDVGLNPPQLVALAKSHGLDTYVNYDTTLDQIRREINAGRPMIVLIAYRFITNRLDQGDATPGRDGHFITIVGYDDTHFVADDPDYWVPDVQRGDNTLIHITELDAAMSGSYMRPCVFVKEGHVATQSEIDNAKAAVNTVLVSANAALAILNAMAPTPIAPPVTPPSPTTTPTPSTRVVYATTSIFVRSTPDSNSTTNKIGGLSVAASVTVKYPAVNNWYQITFSADPKLVGGYVYAPLMSDGG